MHIRLLEPPLSAEQAAARDQILAFSDSDERILTPGGLAGAGKTALLAAVAHIIPKAHVCAPTGKAAHVLRQKMHRHDASPIHALFYKLIDKDVDPETNRRQLRFVRIHVPGALRGKLVLIDEASMIDRWMMQDLIASGAKIVLFGDVGQLPPVHGTQYFANPDITLRQIHRQALGSAIIRPAHEARNTGWYEADDPAFQTARRPYDEDYVGSVAIIGGQCTTRQKVNACKHRVLGFRNAYPQDYETVLRLQNAPAYGVLNGGKYTTLAPFDAETSAMVVEADGPESIIPSCAFATRDDPSEDEDRSTTFSLGYSLTCHKSQCSEFSAARVLDEFPSIGPERERWIYTALTRAANCVLVVQRR